MTRWIELSLTDEEWNRLQVMADAHECSIEALLAEAARSNLNLFERIGAMFPRERLGPPPPSRPNPTRRESTR